LFGLTPQAYERQQYQQSLQEGQAFGTPEGLYASAAQLGRGLGGAMGAVDPMLQKISAQNQILQGLDITNPQSIASGIERAQQAGIPELAFKLVAVRDEAVTRQQKQLAAQRQMMAQRIAMGAYDPGQAAQLIPESVVVDQAADTSYLEPQRVAPAVAPSYDISRVAPQLMALGPEGVAQLTTAKAAQKAATKSKVIGYGKGALKVGSGALGGALAAKDIYELSNKPRSEWTDEDYGKAVSAAGGLSMTVPTPITQLGGLALTGAGMAYPHVAPHVRRFMGNK
jgi:hypothetical protein